MPPYLIFLMGFLYCLIGVIVFLKDVKITKMKKGDTESEPMLVWALYITFLIVLVFWPIILLYNLLFPEEL